MAKLTPIKAIRQKCIDCCAGQCREVAHCTVQKCALYEYRNGHRPKGGQFTAEDELSEKKWGG